MLVFFTRLTRYAISGFLSFSDSLVPSGFIEKCDSLPLIGFIVVFDSLLNNGLLSLV